METTSVINLLPSSDLEVVNFKRMLCESILAGNENPLKILRQLALFEKVISDVRKDADIENAIINEFDKHGTKTIEMFGSKFSKKEVGTSYDYSCCDDNELEYLEDKLGRIKEEVETRKDFLKSITGEVFDTNGIKLNAPVKTSKTKICITL